MNRELLIKNKPFNGSNDFKNHERKVIKEKETNCFRENGKVVVLSSLNEVFDKLKIKDGDTLSFHHHLRNGDYVLNLVCEEIKKRNLKNLHLAPSSIFPNNKILVDLIENENVTNIHTDYLNGEVSEAITSGKLKGLLVMQTHGGRPRAIEAGELPIDVAFVAAPTVDKNGNAVGYLGKSACGALGYAIPDVKYAKRVVLVTDNFIDSLNEYEIDGKYVDYIVCLKEIGNPKGIVSGTTKITKDPVGLKIARDTAKLLNELGLIKEGFSMQTGAGGTSLAVASYVKKIMMENHIRGSFASGGITGYFVEMLESNMFDKLMDVQCFDLEAVRSYKENKNHYGMSAFKYADCYEDCVVNNLDFVILGATEIDTSFNVNVTTDSKGNIIGGSGGHSDTAYGAKVTVIVTNLVKSRLPIIKENVITISTPGEDVDVVVTERGIAINPKRKDLIEKLKDSKLNIITIEELKEIAYEITGKPKSLEKSNKVVGIVEYRDGTIIDKLYER